MPMTANPITDQYLARARNAHIPHTNCPTGGCKVERNETAWIAELQLTLPDVDPAVIGQVLLHVGTLLPQLTQDEFLFAVKPGIIGPYLHATLRNLGADLVSPRDADTPAAPTDGV